MITGCFAACIAAAAHAGTISWIGPTTIAGNSDIEKGGATVFAYSGGTADSVNGVTFIPTLSASLNNSWLQLTGFTGLNTGIFTTTSNNFAALSPVYKNIIKGGVYNNGAVATVKLKNLVVGRNYTVQIWVSDPRSGAPTNRYAVVDSTGPILPYNDAQVEGGVGSYAVGSFTADAATQSFTLAGDVSTQLNAVQLRVERVPLREDLYWDANEAAAGFGAAGGTWGSDPNWSTNALGATLPDQPVNTTISNTLHFGTAATGLGAGTISVSGTQSFDSLTFGVASEAITITNGTLAFATPAATLRLNSTENTIASALAPGNSLTVRSVRPLICDGFPTTVERILFANAALADYTGAEAKIGGAWTSSGPSTPIPASVYHWVNDGTSASFQVQTFDGGHTKVVKIALRQAGAHIAGRAVYAKHCDPDGNILGNDFDYEGTGSTVATWFSADGYGVTELKLLPYDERFTQHRFRQFLATTPQTIAIDANLADFSTAECFMAGGSIQDDLQPASTFHFVSDGTTATFQVQCYDDIYTKCVKVELTQAGSDIQARLIYARYNNGNNLGHNFDLSWSSGNIAASFGSGGYGVRSIRLINATPTLTLTAKSAFNGPIDLAASTLKLNGLLANGVMTGSIVNNGAIVCCPPAPQQFSGAISGTGSFTVNGIPGATITYKANLTKTPVVIAENRTLADCRSAGGFFSGTNISDGLAAAAPFHFTNNGTIATVQLQVYNGGHTKVVKVELKQVGANIEAKVIYAKHCSEPHGNNVGADYDTTGIDYDYTLSQLSLYVAPVRLTDYNTYSGGTVVNSGELEVTTLSSLPMRGGIVVNGGTLLLNAPGINNKSVVGGMDNSITVFAGGTLSLAGKHNAGYNRRICIDGGTLHSTAGTAVYNDNYLNNLKLMNGAQVTGNPIQFGYESAAILTVAGTSPSIIHSGISCVNLNNLSLTLDVADVTNDSNPDLIIPGVVTDWSALYLNQPIIKSGAGTVSFSHSGNNHKGLFTIKAGRIMLAADNTMNADNPVVLDGGALDMGTVANTVGTLKVSGTGGTLALGTGTLAFANSSAVAWSGTLTLAGTLVEQSVRFGTDSSGLTAEQLSAIEYNGDRSVRINSSGYLTAKPAGSTFMLR